MPTVSNFNDLPAADELVATVVAIADGFVAHGIQSRFDAELTFSDGDSLWASVVETACVRGTATLRLPMFQQFPERWTATIPDRYITAADGVKIPIAGQADAARDFTNLARDLP